MKEASRRQIDAADPRSSTWLSANAGSGKTRVLTDRVARLLLGGTPPQNILCLTFTKAAAGEMQNRLFARLGEWAMKPDAALAAELRAIGVHERAGPRWLAEARTLFARAIETPGGLKIQTIHSFCAALLRQFPLESGVTPGFREIDEREARLIRHEVFDLLAEGPLAATLAGFAQHCSIANIDATLEEIIAHAGAFAEPVSEAEIPNWFGLPQGLDRSGAVAEALNPRARADLAAIAAILARGSEASRRQAAALSALLGLHDQDAAFSGVAELVLTREGTLRKPLFAAVAKGDAGAAERLESLGEAIATALDRLASLEEAEKTLALHRFGRAYAAAYATRKAAAGLLDFDDLIRGALRLLSRSDVADWVLFKLDGGIDHILVDEAQDTSPGQWAIIGHLAQEFTAGHGARDGVWRTVFAVGDRKQSIYSFQGADPAEFDRMRDYFSGRLASTDRPLRERALLHSFRSSPLILQLVDRLFDGSSTRGAEEPTEHVAFHRDLPGRIDLVPLIRPAERPDPPDWHDAADRILPRDAPLALAARLADSIARMVDEEHLPDGAGGMRPLTAGDILVLVRRRDFISDALILELKRRGLDVAGADQIVLTADLAVMDVLAVLKVLTTPADSLSLAAALRSPLFGLGEAALYSLCRARPEAATLWEALLASRDRFPEVVAILEDLMHQADFLRPFELIERLLVRHAGRRRLRSRLGDEVDESLNVLLQQALAYEAGDVPSLTGFLAWHEVEGVRVRRQTDGGGGKLRVMTVHGAKGLESPVVILPDTADYNPPERDRFIVLPNGQPVFRSPDARRPAALVPIYEAERRRDEEETDRLLYVALTRAKHWLIVCGAGKDSAKEGKQPCWHRLVAQAMAGMGPAVQGEGGAIRLQSGNWPPARSRGRTLDPGQELPPLPAWTALPAGPGPALPRFLSPSRLGERLELTAGRPADHADRAEALQRGSGLHLLLEHLPLHPRTAWPDLAAALLGQAESLRGPEEVADLLAEAESVLAAPDLGWLFAADALAEVDVTAALPSGPARLFGRIDRLVRLPDGAILAVDFKSGTPVPDRVEAIAPGILAQLGAYVAALGQIFPGCPVSSAVLWTRQARLMPVPNEIVLAALARATIS